MNIEIKKPVYTNAEKTQIDVELNHPQFGWIPYTFHTDTTDESFDELIREYLQKDDTVIEPFTEEDTQ
jgi:hypothetical protein